MINGLERGLIIKEPWVDLILDGEKDWEIRGSDTKIRGRIGLIQSGSGLIIGEVFLNGTRPIRHEDFNNCYAFHKVSKDVKIPYKTIWAWMLVNQERYAEPIPYKHPQGAVIWVKL